METAEISLGVVIPERHPKKSAMKTTFSGLLLALSLIVLGCAHGGIAVSPVTGTIEFEGAPLAGAVVSFIPVDENGRGAGGVTDKNGRFILLDQGAKSAGAVPGEYIVCVAKYIYINAAGRALTDEEIGKLDSPPRTKNILPAKYAPHADSDLKAVVEKRRNHFVFKLTND